MVEWENEHKDAHPASPAEKEILIFQILNWSIFRMNRMTCPPDPQKEMYAYEDQTR